MDTYRPPNRRSGATIRRRQGHDILGAVRRRLPVAAASAALAATLLTACHSNVGAAATVDGHRITESDVSKYVGVNAQGIPEQDSGTGQTTNVPPKSFVLSTLINSQLFEKVLRELRTESGRAYPTPAEFAAAEASVLQGATLDQLKQGVQRSGLKGSFASVYLRERAFEAILSDEASADNGAKLDQVIAKLHPKVSVNPRFGSWDQKTFTLAATQKDGVPSFLRANATYTPPAPASTGSPEASTPAPSATG
jgi:hypothetical protein